MKRYLPLLLLLLLVVQQATAQKKTTKKEQTKQSNKNKYKEKGYKIRGIVEAGFLGAFDHKIKFGLDNENYNTTYFDYVKDGGQENLFFNARLSIEFEFHQRNVFTFSILVLSIIMFPKFPLPMFITFVFL